MKQLRVSHIKKLSRVEGPGLRYVIWVQGCPLRCKGCFNPHTWDEKGGSLVALDELLLDIEQTLLDQPQLEGVTFLGGEPFEQADALSQLGAGIKQLDLTIVTFSGYTYEQLKKTTHQPRIALLALTDLLIDGPYMEELHDLSRPWVGSKNQNYRFLSDTYKTKSEEILSTPNQVEITIKTDGTIHINGMIATVDLEKLLS